MERHLFRPSITNSSDCSICGLGQRELQEGSIDFLHTNYDAKMTITLRDSPMRLNQPITPPLSSTIYNAANPAPGHHAVTSPSHYTDFKVTPVEVIEDWQLDFHLGNAVKYIGRHKKRHGLEDLKKAHWYLSRKIELMEAQVDKPKAV